MTKLYRRSVSSGFTLVEVIAVMLLISLLVSLSVPSLINYRKTSDAKSLSDHIKTDILKVYSMSRRFSAFCSVFYTLHRWPHLSSKKLDLITSEKLSSRSTTYSPLIARCAEDSNDLLPGANLLYNENIVNRLPDYLFLSLNKRLFGFTPRGLSNGSLDTLLLVGLRSSTSTSSVYCIKVSSITGKVSSGIYHSSIPSSVRASSYSLLSSLRPDECY